MTEYIKNLNLTAKRLGIPAFWLDSLILSESGRNKFARNPKSNAYSYIQFMPSTLNWLGYSEEFINKSESNVFEAIYQYISKTKKANKINKINSQGELYSLIFFPPIAKGTYPKKGEKEYDQNAALDRDKDNDIDKKDLQNKMESKNKESLEFLNGRKINSGIALFLEKNINNGNFAEFSILVFIFVFILLIFQRGK